MKSYINDNRRGINKEEIHRRNKSGDFGLPSTKLKSITPLVLQPKILQYNQERRSNRDSNKLGSVPKVGKTPDKTQKKNDYRNESDTNLPILRTSGKKAAGQTVNSGTHKQSKSFEMHNSMEMDKNTLLAKYRYLIRSPNIPNERISNFLQLVIRGLHYSTQCLKPPSKKFIQSRRIKLQERPPDFKKKTLYLDLDETIVFQCKDKNEKATFEVPIDDKETQRFSARPHWKTFQEKVTEDFEIIIFTASTQYYAFQVANALDPDKKYFSGILSRNHCMLTKNGFFIKDQRLIENRQIKNVALLDNYVHSFAFNIENGIPILEWKNEQDDDELLHMLGYLKDQSACEDCRVYNKEHQKLIDVTKKSKALFNHFQQEYEDYKINDQQALVYETVYVKNEDGK